MSDKVDRYRQYADNARKRSDAAFQGSHDAVSGIPFGQPILVGHHSEGRHRAALKRQDSRMRKSIEEDEKAKYWESRAGHVEHRENALEQAKELSDVAEGHFDDGEQVIARFTNCNRFHEFPGVIVGRTKNDWKVKASVSPYADQGEAPGRVFYIPTISSRKHSQNNCIVKVCGMQTLGPDDSIKPCRLAKNHDGFCDTGVR